MILVEGPTTGSWCHWGLKLSTIKGVHPLNPSKSFHFLVYLDLEGVEHREGKSTCGTVARSIRVCLCVYDAYVFSLDFCFPFTVEGISESPCEHSQTQPKPSISTFISCIWYALNALLSMSKRKSCYRYSLMSWIRNGRLSWPQRPEPEKINKF